MDASNHPNGTSSPVSSTHDDFAPLTEIEQSIPARFEQIASLYPAKMAVEAGHWQPTYQELNETANALGGNLVARGLKPGDRVALLMQHEGQLFGAALATLKAGGIVVVLNPTEPPARLQQVLTGAEPRLIITDTANRNLAGEIFPEKKDVVPFEESHSGPTDNLNLAITPGNVAFLIYTSGSAGRPKGVMQTHRNILHNVRRLSAGIRIKPDDRHVLLAALSGGQGIATTWCALLSGGTLYPFPLVEQGFNRLAACLREHRITIYVSSASVFRSFVKTLAADEFFPDIRLVRLGSESASAHDFAAFKQHFPTECVLFHTLSSSEAGNITQIRLTRHDQIDGDRLPAGKLSDGMEILLLDELGREVAEGATGEIAVRSRYLSPGYWRNETLTAERFSDSIHTPGLRLFRSGDLGRRSADGQFQFMGRRDAQVKIHGYRVEISEIEQALIRCPEVENAVVCPYHPAGQEIQLIGYVVSQAGKTCTSDSLRTWAATILPRYMVPAHFIFLEAFPLTPHGKIDRHSLPAPSNIDESNHAAENFATETEKVLAGIWRQVFDRRAIHSNTNFFELGGDSLSAAVLASQIHSKFNVELDFKMLSNNSTVGQLAAVIDERQKLKRPTGSISLVRLPRNGPLPLSYTEEPMWDQWLRGGNAARRSTIATSYSLHGPLDVQTLRDCLSDLVRRHENLRTTFEEQNGQPVRNIHDARPVQLPEIDLSIAATVPPENAGLANFGLEQKVYELLQKESRQPFDLTKDFLIRPTLVKVRPDEHYLLLVSHHIILDRLSWTIYFRELAQLYEAKQRGEPAPLPDHEPVQYADYAVWQRKMCDPARPEFQTTVRWWHDLLTAPERPARRSHWHNFFKPFADHQLRATSLPWKRRWPTSGLKPSDGYIHWGIDPDVSQRLAQISREQHVTLFMTRLAAFAALLAHESGKNTLLLGARVANRTRPEFQNIFGFFANVSLLRIDCDLSLTFRQWLDEICRITSETFEHSYVPRRLLSKELKKLGVRLPKRDIDFSIAEDTRPLEFGGLRLQRAGRAGDSSPSTFTLTIDPHDESHGCYAGFAPNLYPRDKVQAFLERLKKLLEAASRDADATLVELIARVA